jgi:flagellin-specific chaperone FliS
MSQIERIWEFLQRLTPLTRSCLLNELERLDVSGIEIPGSADIQARLRAEFRKDGPPQNRMNTPSRVFFMPLDPFLIETSPEHENPGRIPRGSLAPIWEWIGRDLLPTMTRDFNAQMKDLIAAEKQREARQVASAFQTKVVKYLESTLGSPDGAEQTRLRLASYTASRSAYGDLIKIMCVLRARAALANFDEVLPKRQIVKFDNPQVAKMSALLAKFSSTNAEALPFAITLIVKRMKAPWQVLRLATKAAASKKASDVAATPFAVAVPMVMDRIDDNRTALRIALRNNRILIAKQLLADAYDIEYALRVRIDKLDESDWGVRLRGLMDAIAELVEAEVKRFPDEVGHVLGSRRLRGYQSLAGRLTYFAWRGRDAITNGASYCIKLIGA